MPALEVKANVHTCLLMSVPVSVPELCVFYCSAPCVRDTTWCIQHCCI